MHRIFRSRSARPALPPGGVHPLAATRSLVRAIAGLGLAAIVTTSGQAIAAPIVPASDATVLERLPFKANDPVAREMASLRRQLQLDPNNQVVAAKLAQRYFDLVGEEGDPRYLGYAEAALAPWWKLPAPPDEIQVLRASLKQFRHEFASAIQDLDAVLARTPRHAQARALRAILHIVQARYAAARSDCNALHDLSSELIATGCETMVDGLNGQNGSAYQRLNAALQATPNASKGDQLWILLRLAEMAQRLDRPREAELHFKRALSLDILNTFLLAAWADFLLDQHRNLEVMSLLQEKGRSDNLLLRMVLAEQGKSDALALQHRATLAARYAAAQMRGDTVHQQEEARFALRIENNPAKALRLAQENWKVQREPRDARILLEAALAQHDAAGAQPVLQWLAESHHEDPLLLKLAQQLAALPQNATALKTAQKGQP
jgi:hypothetical protein